MCAVQKKAWKVCAFHIAFNSLWKQLWKNLSENREFSNSLHRRWTSCGKWFPTFPTVRRENRLIFQHLVESDVENMGNTAENQNDISQKQRSFLEKLAVQIVEKQIGYSTECRVYYSYIAGNCNQSTDAER